MDIELPNGVVIKDVPEGTTKAQIMEKAIRNGLAKPEDFAVSQPQPQPQTQPYREPTFGEKLIGAGETGLTLLTGGTTGLAGTVGGAITGAYEEVKSGQFGTPEAARRIEQRAALGGQQYTYAPRTQAGQEQVEMLGRVGAELIPIAPVFHQVCFLKVQNKPLLHLSSVEFLLFVVLSKMPHQHKLCVKAVVLLLLQCH